MCGQPASWLLSGSPGVTPTSSPSLLSSLYALFLTLCFGRVSPPPGPSVPSLLARVPACLPACLCACLCADEVRRKVERLLTAIARPLVTNITIRDMPQGLQVRMVEWVARASLHCTALHLSGSFSLPSFLHLGARKCLNLDGKVRHACCIPSCAILLFLPFVLPTSLILLHISPSPPSCFPPNPALPLPHP